jgi:hypothetical protein
VTEPALEVESGVVVAELIVVSAWACFAPANAAKATAQQNAAA